VRGVTLALAPPGVGGLLREWRLRRRLSQLELAGAAEVSTRHLSFVETGRSRPSRELVVHLAEHLDVPLRERNTLLLAAGYAPVYRETPLDADEMTPVRDAVDAIVRGHEPFPAVVVNRSWDVLTANAAAARILVVDLPGHVLGPPLNALRVALHPDGLAPRIVNLTEWSAHLLDRLDREVQAGGSADLAALAEELRGYPGVSPRAAPVDGAAAAHRLFVPLVLRDGDRVLRFLSTVATFGTPLDVTVAELSIESFFPADTATAGYLAAAG
jgi:transcriptional regulator with XRE-family HTH domain